MIVAVDKNLGIGFKNKLLKSIPEDLKRFKQLTNGSVVIMGYNTYLSLPKKPLPNRINIVLFDKKIELDGCVVVNSKEEALSIAKTYNIPIFIIGGGSIYGQFLSETDKLFLTLIDGEFEADTFFPNFYNDFEEINRESHIEQGYTFIDYKRK